MSILDLQVLLKYFSPMNYLFSHPLNAKLVYSGYFKAQYFNHKQFAKDTLLELKVFRFTDNFVFQKCHLLSLLLTLKS